jgi:hypothetical protein
VRRTYIPKGDGKEGFDFLGFHHPLSFTKYREWTEGSSRQSKTCSCGII